MQVRDVDPRDISWELDQPTYRVYFFTGDPASGFTSDEYELTEVDAPEVLSWAESDGRGYLAYIVHQSASDGQLGLIRLSGSDPTS